MNGALPIGDLAQVPRVGFIGVEVGRLGGQPLLFPRPALGDKVTGAGSNIFLPPQTADKLVIVFAHSLNGSTDSTLKACIHG